MPVVVAPAGGAQTRAALPELTGTGRAVLTSPDRLVIADCGRLAPGSAAWPLLRLADVVLVMARARTDELAHLREALAELVDVGAGRLVVLLAAGGVYPAADVAEVLSTHVAEELARDPACAGRARAAARRPQGGGRARRRAGGRDAGGGGCR